MPRAFLIVLDSVGIGGAPDAAQYFNGDTPDTGSNTVGHIHAARPLAVPTLASLGLWRALDLASGVQVAGPEPTGAWGAATELSRGKDTPSGHWELAGLPVPFDWHRFDALTDSFPADLVAQTCQIAGVDGVLGNCHASGTEIIDRLGAEHIRTGWPICYTSADSVFQIAAHEQHFGLTRLMDLCQALAPTLHAMKVGRVIARPFVGEPGAFARTANRHDYAMEPPDPTLCDWVHGAGRTVHGVGKIGDIFSMRGISDCVRGPDDALMDGLLGLMDSAGDGSLTFANFVEFDSLYGHRRDVEGYAKHLEWADGQLAQVLTRAKDGDLIVITADHGNDPTWVGTDHTRERVPVLVHGLGARPLGHMGFADVAATIADWLNIPAQGQGRSVL